MAELPLFIFTLCLQTAIGIIIFSMIAKQFQKELEFKLGAIIAACLSIVGLLASLIHLGTPLRALNSLLNLGSSWLSREILFSGGFAGLAIVYAFLVYKMPEQKKLVNAVGWIASVVGLVDVFMMAKIYMASSVHVWQSGNTMFEFYGTMIILGISVLFLTNFKNIDEKLVRYFSLCVFIVVAVLVASVIPHYLHLGLMEGAGAASAEILNGKIVLIIAQWLLLILGSTFLLFFGKTEGGSKFSIMYVPIAAIIIALIIGRYLFYAAFVASRVGLT
ncbi:dimethyl sulfoxide reductase anchor subunit family protein [Bacillus massiliigorillae]|uniref:dimethyl sulfoxide reductase anchor subunit family protein n=1 Tax=Bacillus massiliigorillae TaxID=1243664 RepID=UPI0003A9DDD6|nr:DmsC/YnfH family molybdoenzyme membrane anchor subunit [Bacillus massiliigorillae]